MTDAENSYLSVESHVGNVHADTAGAPLQTEVAVWLDALADSEVATA